mgnify:CR=1 FL=1
MRTPPAPDNEQQRLWALIATGLLDRAAEDRFDRITRTASRLFDVPIALIGLIDQDREWLLSSVGLPLRQLPREVSFCAHTILADNTLVVADASADARFCHNPLVVDDPCIRFYAGHALRNEEGHAYGTLGLFDRAPRDFSEDDCAALRDLAHVAENEIGRGVPGTAAALSHGKVSAHTGALSPG